MPSPDRWPAALWLVRHGQSAGNVANDAALAAGSHAAATLGAVVASRGASPLTAACWGAVLHGRAGERVVGRIGFLARELLDELPGLLPT